jgi:hypothetical protein
LFRIGRYDCPMPRPALSPLHVCFIMTRPWHDYRQYYVWKLSCSAKDFVSLRGEAPEMTVSMKSSHSLENTVAAESVVSRYTDAPVSSIMHQPKSSFASKIPVVSQKNPFGRQAERDQPSRPVKVKGMSRGSIRTGKNIKICQ